MVVVVSDGRVRSMPVLCSGMTVAEEGSEASQGFGIVDATVVESGRAAAFLAGSSGVISFGPYSTAGTS